MLDDNFDSPQFLVEIQVNLPIVTLLKVGEFWENL